MAPNDDWRSAPVTAFICPEMEGPPITHTPRYFERLDLAIRFVVEQLPLDRAWGTYIRLPDDRRIGFEEIKKLYALLDGSN